MIEKNPSSEIKLPSTRRRKDLALRRINRPFPSSRSEGRKHENQPPKKHTHTHLPGGQLRRPILPSFLKRDLVSYRYSYVLRLSVRGSLVGGFSGENVARKIFFRRAVQRGGRGGEGEGRNSRREIRFPRENWLNSTTRWLEEGEESFIEGGGSQWPLPWYFRIVRRGLRCMEAGGLMKRV